MGTRADFYVGRGKSAEWLGSIAMDGYPEPPGVLAKLDLIGREAAWRAEVARFIDATSHGTSPDMGWPWPWVSSATTDYAYALDDGRVWCSHFGGHWFDPTLPPNEDGDRDLTDMPAEFPVMTPPDNPFHERSGVIVLSAKP